MIESMLLIERIKTLAPPGTVYVLAQRGSAGPIEQPAQWSAISAVSNNSWLGQTLSAQRARRDDMVRNGQNRLPRGPLLISGRSRPRLCAFRSPRLAAACFTDGDCRALPCQQECRLRGSCPGKLSARRRSRLRTGLRVAVTLDGKPGLMSSDPLGCSVGRRQRVLTGGPMPRSYSTCPLCEPCIEFGPACAVDTGGRHAAL